MTLCLAVKQFLRFRTRPGFLHPSKFLALISSRDAEIAVAAKWLS